MEKLELNLHIYSQLVFNNGAKNTHRGQDSFLLNTTGKSWVLVAHVCNPSFSGDRDQEDGSSKSAQANSLQNILSKKHIMKWSGLRCRP
jgi:hypothetical protein